MDKLKKVMSESLSEKVLKDIDSRTPQQSPWKGKPFKSHKKRHPTNQVTEVSDDDAYNLIEEEEEEDWDEQDVSGDPDQVAHVDEDGWFYADEETIDQVDETIAMEDADYAHQVVTYTEARNALAKARIARGFYPVVVPADDGRQPRFGRSGTKGKAGGKGKNKAKAKASPKRAAAPKSSGPGMSSGSSGPKEVICFRCGKKGHLSRNCPNQPLAKRARPSQDSAAVVFDMSPWAHEFAEWRRQQAHSRSAGARSRRPT